MPDIYINNMRVRVCNFVMDLISFVCVGNEICLNAVWFTNRINVRNYRE